MIFVLIEQLVELSTQDGMTLEKAAKMIAKQFGINNKKKEGCVAKFEKTQTCLQNIVIV